MGDRSTGRYDYLRTVDRDALEEALRASGMRPGNRAAGALVLKRRLDATLGWQDWVYVRVVRDLQDLASELCPGTGERWARHAAHWIMYRLALGGLAYRSHGGTGDCPCLWCRIWRMWLGELEEALSSY